MKNKLLIFGRFAHDSQRILAAIFRFALVSVERRFNSLFRICLKLRVATLAYADHWRSIFHDPQLAPWHASSLAHLVRTAECL